MSGTEIRFQGIVWTFGEREFAALLMDGHSTDEPDVLLTAARSRGLPLTTDVRRLPLALVPGWRIEVTSENERTRLTVHWPRVHPLLSHADVDLPRRWQQLAVTQRAGLLLIGRDLVADGTVPARERDLPSRVARLAEAGSLAAGVVAFRSGTRARIVHHDRRPEARRAARR